MQSFCIFFCLLLWQVLTARADDRLQLLLEIRSLRVLELWVFRFAVRPLLVLVVVQGVAHVTKDRLLWEDAI